MPLEPIVPPYLPGPSRGLEGQLRALARAAKAGKRGAQEELRHACQMLEAHFLSWLLREMRATIPRSGLLPYGPAEETYDFLLDDALSRAIAQSGGFGLAKIVEAQLSQRAPAANQSHGNGNEPPPKPSEGNH